VRLSAEDRLNERRPQKFRSEEISMKHLGKVMNVLSLLVVSAAAQVNGGGTASYAPVWVNSNTLGNSQIQIGPRFPRRRSSQNPSMHQAQAWNRETTSPDVTWVQCPPEAQALGATCGQLPVPLDRQHPEREKTNAYFELYLHTNPGPAVSAIFANPGGPGLTTTGLRGLIWLPLYGVTLDVHDFVLFDDRGRGSSAAINCSDLQHGTALFNKAVAECAAQLDAGASAYGTGAIADDAEALRAALGYDKIDYLGVSYGGEDATAYATRYGSHLRSILLDAPAGSPYLPAFAADRGSTSSIPRAIQLGCQRSPTCRVDHPDPDSELTALIQSIHNDPLIGTGNNAFGVPTPVKMDEGSLAALLTAGTGPPFGPPGSGGFVDDNEVLAAAQAYANGDSVPLLRIGAEQIIPLSIDYGDPTFFSEGDFIAALCSDMHQPFKWSDSVSLRRSELSEAISDLPSDYFAPFTKGVARYPIFAFEAQCLNWQEPTPSDPVLPEKPVFPDVPVLVLHGDMDAQISTEQARAIAEQFPSGTFIQIASSGHVTSGFGQCGTNISNNFLETLQPGDTSCAQTPETVWPAVGRFPLFAVDALPATPVSENHGTVHDLKVVSVALATMRDALQRTTLGSTGGVGLRGGTWTDTVGTTSQVITLNGCLFTEDVSVSGTITYGFDTSLSASLSVTLSDGTTGTLNVTGSFLQPGPVGNFFVTGSIGGRQIAALVPEA
jgi:pimeloyl-ACP methyl ester carboxylesterase